MKRWAWLAFPLALVVMVGMVGCEGEEGAQGPQGPAGPPGESIEDVYTYLGNEGEACRHCHASTVELWSSTGHVEAYADLDADGKANIYCIQCHVTGWDVAISYGQTEFDPADGADMYGYDNYHGVTGDEATDRRAALEGVQCEACHGPMGPDFNAHEPMISFSTHSDADGNSTSLCAPCHKGQLDEWALSGHGHNERGTIEEFQDEHFAHIGSCQGCHVSEGFIRENDPRYATYEFGHEVSFIGCVTCHDPHSDAMNAVQLRAISDVMVEYHPGLDDESVDIPKMTGKGNSQLCAACHHARRDTENVEGQIAEGYEHFGPHASPQMDMVIGYGSYEIADLTYEHDHVHYSGSASCVGCHMVRETEVHGSTQDHSFHTFTPDVGNCEPCHTGIADFDIGGLQTTISGKLDEIAVGLGFVDTADMEENFDSQDAVVTVWEREVAYAFFFVLSDGSMGVHNPTYAEALLDNAIAHIAANSGS